MQWVQEITQSKLEKKINQTFELVICFFRWLIQVQNGKRGPSKFGLCKAQTWLELFEEKNESTFKLGLT